LIKRFLVICVFFLLIVTSIGSLSFEGDSKITEQNKLLDDLAFYCTSPNGLNEVKFEYYKEQLLKQDSDENTKEYLISNSEELITIPNTQLITGLSNGPMDSQWTMFAHDVRHTGQSPYSTSDNPYIEKWRYFSKNGFEMGPVIAEDGTIYAGTGWGVMIAINPDGTKKWEYKTDNIFLGSYAPAIGEDGTVYFGAWDTGLYAINPNGTLKWRFGSGGIIAVSPAIGEDGTIYCGHVNGDIFAMNPNGTRKWRYKTGDSVYGTPTIGNDGTIYCSSNDNYLYALYPNGTLKWRFNRGQPSGRTSIADDGTVYNVGAWDNYLYALYPDNGTVKWKCNIKVNSNPSIDSNGTIYIGGDEKLYAVYPNGTKKWTFDLGNEMWTPGTAPAISADGTIYVGACHGSVAGGSIIAVNPDGTERWRKRICDEWVHLSPCIAEDGTVYIGSKIEWGGYIHAFGNIESNSPPEAPIISGKTNGYVGQRYWYTFNSVDPDNNPVSFYIEWGDGTTMGWSWEHASGEDSYFDHTYSEPGTYIIKAKAKDVMGEESDFGYLEVKIIVPPVYKKALIYGIITNLTIEDNVMFEAVHIKVVRFLPFSISLFKSGEKFTLSKNYKGFIGNRLIFSLCTMIL
jgi:outer membrane protein assembly factor BamB